MTEVCAEPFGSTTAQSDAHRETRGHAPQNTPLAFDLAKDPRVNVWTANRRATICKLITWSVDGLFSDSPERVITARAQMAAQTIYNVLSNDIR